MGCARDRCLEVVDGPADRQASRRIADFFEIFEMATGVAGFALGGRAKHRGAIVMAIDIGLLREIPIAAVGLALADERGLEVVLRLRALESYRISTRFRGLLFSRKARRTGQV